MYMKFSTPSMLYMNNFIFNETNMLIIQSTCKLVTDNYISLVLVKRLDYTMLYSWIILINFYRKQFNSQSIKFSVSYNTQHTYLLCNNIHTFSLFYFTEFFTRMEQVIQAHPLKIFDHVQNSRWSHVTPRISNTRHLGCDVPNVLHSNISSGQYYKWKIFQMERIRKFRGPVRGLLTFWNFQNFYFFINCWFINFWMNSLQFSRLVLQECYYYNKRSCQES